MLKPWLTKEILQVQNRDSLKAIIILSTRVPGEVEKRIDALDVKTENSTGPNSIPVFLLKRFKLLFVWPSKLVNPCVEVGTFPDILKLAA